MLSVAWESFLKSVIRFFDNRFVSDDTTFYYRTEIEKLRQRNEFLEDKLIELFSPKTASGTVESFENPTEPLMQPIESFFQKRKRLEMESMQKWTKDVADAREKLVQKATVIQNTQELESSLGLNNGSSPN